MTLRLEAKRADETRGTAPPLRSPRAGIPRVKEIRLRAAARAVAPSIMSAAVVLVVLRLAAQGFAPTWVFAIALPITGVAFVASAVLGWDALRFDDGQTSPAHAARRLARHHGFWLVSIALTIGVPMLGAFSLVDPWETHYAEVAREMIERRDFISPWWAHDGWFMSKPVLTFWLEAASMLLLGAGTGPNDVLRGHAYAARPEWAVRMPGFALAILGAYVLYYGVSRTCGRRAGLLGGLILITMPGFALLSHQALTDMPAAASTSASLGFLLCAIHRQRDASNTAVVDAGIGEVPRIALRAFDRSIIVHAGHAVAAAMLAVVIPQLVLLLSAHVHVDAGGITLGADRVFAGSPHACLLPGQPACAPMRLAYPRLQPIVQVALWAPIAAWLALRIAAETRAHRLYALMAWLAAAVGTMAKGPVAIVVPAVGALVALGSALHARALVRRRSPGHVEWSAPRWAARSFHALSRLEIARGTSLAALVVLPWYLAVFARHGRVFIDELLFRHMLGRTLDHLHDTNAGEDIGLTYFARQLAIAMFPWTGIVAVALFRAASGEERWSARSRARALLGGAALAAFVLVSSMGTKFHHYGLVALPPAAMLAGLWLDERIAETKKPMRARDVTTTFAFVACAIPVLLIGCDLMYDGGGTSPAGPARFVHLLTYRYDRRWPTSETARSVIAAAAALFALCILLFARRASRLRATFGTFGLAVIFTGWLGNVYLARTAVDGGQRGVIEAFYRRLGDGDGHGPLIAYQLNWKGENYYTGNDMAVFVSSGAPMRSYVAKRKRESDGVLYFVTERTRVHTLRAELGTVRAFEELTDRTVSDQFTLVRVAL